MNQQSIDEMDYEKDVLKFKQLWKDLKKTPQIVHNQNNIETNYMKNNRKVIKDTKKPQKQEKKSQSRQKNLVKNKQTIVSQENLQRNPKYNPKEVIEVVTKPKVLQTDEIYNEANKIVPQHMVISQPTKINLGQVNQLNTKLEGNNREISLLRVINTRNEDRIRNLQDKILEKEQIIEELRARERQLLNQKSSLINKEMNINYGKVQYENYRSDSKRLLKMLKSTEQYNTFANIGLEDDGVRFLHSVNLKNKSKIDTIGSKAPQMHYCNCNQAFIPQSGFWVPDKIYNYGKDFLKERKGLVTQAQIELLLYELNKIWRQREKRIINSMNGKRANQIDKLKRKFGTTIKKTISSGNYSKQKINLHQNINNQ